MMSAHSLQTLLKRDKELVRDVFIAVDDFLHLRKKRISHVRFARPTKHGWSFFKDKKVSWDLLEEITHRASSNHPQHKNIVVDIVSEIVNLSPQEFSTLRSFIL